MKSFVGCVLGTMLMIAGCSDGGPGMQPVDGPGVMIRYQSKPLADVQVRLHAEASGPPIAQAVSAADGVARFADIPSPEPDEYFVSLASLGDGGWMLDTKYLNPADSGFTLKPLSSDDRQRIEIPRGAVRTLQEN